MSAIARLRPPSRPLPPLREGDVRVLSVGTRLYRVYRQGASGSWNSMRTYGPTTSRFDPHEPPPHGQDRGILYLAGSLPTALAEVFGTSRVIERTREDPWLIGFALSTDVRVLDLGGGWPSHAGGNERISSGPKDVAREWGRAIYEDYDVDGLLYRSSNSDNGGRRGDPPMHGSAVALFDRSAAALPAHPVVHLPLRHGGLDAGLGVVADRYGYGLTA